MDNIQIGGRKTYCSKNSYWWRYCDVTMHVRNNEFKNRMKIGNTLLDTIQREQFPNTVT